MKPHYFFEDLMYKDTLGLKRRHRLRNYRCVYALIALVPALLAFAVVFFMIFYMSPRGRHMRQY